MTEEIRELRQFIDEAVEDIDSGNSPLLALKKLQHAVGELLRNPLDEAPIELEADTSEGLLSKPSNAEVMEMLRINHEMLVRARIYEEEFRERLLEVMEENEITRSSNDFMSASYIQPSTSQRFDTKRFREEHPELAAEYMKKTERKGYVRVSYKD